MTTSGVAESSAEHASGPGGESPAERYDRLAALLAATVAAVPAGAWDNPSPCDDWTARQVLQHIIDVTAWQATRVGLTLPKESAGDDPVAAWAATRTAVVALLSDPAQAGLTYEGMFGTTTIGATYDSYYTFDLVIHRWDIARATGVDEVIPARDVAMVQGMVEGMGDLIRMEGVAKAAVEVPGDADAQTKLLAYLGRAA